MASKTVLITGVAGMIGSHLLDELLDKGYTVTGMDDLSYGSEANIAHQKGHSRFTFLKIIHAPMMRVRTRERIRIIFINILSFTMLSIVIPLSEMPSEYSGRSHKDFFC